ncbi:hypothetical protein AGMMS49944_08810 [Spirochaetia bacterium]|nr:hypothetical protein AGMMS49944_08810 [Spirochaetia bacterium]
MSTILLLLCVGIAILLAILVNKKIISKYENTTKNVLYVVTFVVFILAGLSVFAISRVQKWVAEIIVEKIDFVEEIIVTAYPDNVLVTSGINSDEVQDGIDELRDLFPVSIIDDDGLFTAIIESQYKNYIDIVFNKLESKINLITRFAENDVVTLSSFLVAIETIAFSYCNKAFLIVYLIVFVIIGIYLICCVVMRNKNIISYNKSITFGGEDT